MENVGLVGLEARELPWLKLVLILLRHPDPVVGQVVREALHYLEEVARRADQTRAAG